MRPLIGREPWLQKWCSAKKLIGYQRVTMIIRRILGPERINMPKFNLVLAGVAAAGLMAASPAMAQTRAADSFPAASTVVNPAAVDRAAMQDDDDDDDGIGAIFGGSPFLVLLLLGAIGATVLIASGGGNGNDSPG